MAIPEVFLVDNQSVLLDHKEETGVRLTGREKQVLKKLLLGKKNQEIGAELGISGKTVEKHLASLFIKLGVKTRVEAAVWAVKEGWTA